VVGCTSAVRFIPRNFKDLFQLASAARSSCAVRNKSYAPKLKLGGFVNLVTFNSLVPGNII
jgi:hypothetical protein